jgi:putative protease
MATRRKAKGKAKTVRNKTVRNNTARNKTGRNKSARKNEARRKKMRAGKGARRKSVKKVRTVRKTQAKKALKNAPLRPASRKTARPSKPKTSPISGAPSRLAKPASSEQRIGVVTHYYNHLSVAVMQLEPGATLRVGDVIHIWGHTTDFTQKVESLEVDHASVAEVGPKDDFGLKVIEHAREHDVVFKVRS